MEKDFVSLGYKICPVCEKQTDDCVLIDRRLRKTLERKSFVGFALCEEHKKEGFITIIGIDPEKSNMENGKITPQGAYKTGRILFVKKEVFCQIFNLNIDVYQHEFVYVEDNVIDLIQEQFKDIIKYEN